MKISSNTSRSLIAACGVDRCVMFRAMMNLSSAMFFFTIFLFTTSGLLLGCQQAVTLDAELPFEEKIVVRGVLVAGELLSDIQVSKTIPPLDIFSYDKVLVRDADVRVRVDDSVTYQLTLQQSSATTATNLVPRSLYEARGIRVVAGKSYAITVRWNGKEARATTRVPQPLGVVSTRLVSTIVPRIGSAPLVADTVLTVEALLRIPRNVPSAQLPGVRIGATMSGGTSATRTAADLTQLSLQFALQNTLPSTNTTAIDTLRLRTEVWRNVARFLALPQTSIQAVIEVYPPDFAEYYATRNRGGQPDILNPSGPNVEWNVAGDGLGLWTGLTVQRVPVPLR
jgi:hypothetical protein